ncbi:MAG: FecR domain-containing protein [Clostridiales bacterium]|nr:FecR domain-containing protein [Clostridiales bacterium]
MISINLPKNLTFGMKLLYGILAVSVIVVIVCVIIFSRNTYLAKSMKLVRAEGTVKIEQEGGKLRQIKKNARFQSGEALVTYAGSLASVNLDDTKIITLQENSRAEFTKMNKQLALKLTQGALFFEVTQKLNADEIFEIKTSTITAGIKGTSGYFYTDEEGRETLTVTDGKVIISAVNPETGERKYAEVSGGQRLVVNLYSESNKEHDTIELKVTDLVEEDLEDFALKMLGENERLLDRVCVYTGWDRAKLRELINAYIVSNLSISDTTPSSEESSEEPSEPETSPEDTETQGATDNTPTPAPTGKETERRKLRLHLNRRRLQLLRQRQRLHLNRSRRQQPHLCRSRQQELLNLQAAAARPIPHPVAAAPILHPVAVVVPTLRPVAVAEMPATVMKAATVKIGRIF